MNKYWQLPNTKDIVLIRDNYVYYGQSETEIPEYFDKISLDKIKKIENSEKSKYLKFYDGSSVENISIESEKIKTEIIKKIYLNSNIGKTYQLI